jgi:hypothetical protein
VPETLRCSCWTKSHALDVIRMSDRNHQSRPPKPSISPATASRFKDIQSVCLMIFYP